MNVEDNVDKCKKMLESFLSPSSSRQETTMQTNCPTANSNNFVASVGDRWIGSNVNTTMLPVDQTGITKKHEREVVHADQWSLVN